MLALNSNIQNSTGPGVHSGGQYVTHPGCSAGDIDGTMGGGTWCCRRPEPSCHVASVWPWTGLMRQPGLMM